MTDPTKLANVSVELDALEAVWAGSPYSAIDVEGDVRHCLPSTSACGASKTTFATRSVRRTFDAEFIRLARAVYIENDERAAIKRRLNLKLGSELIEEKSYAPYQG